MRPEDVYELTGVTDPRISPDGRLAAYVVWSIDRDRNDYRGAIWVAALDGSEPPRQFTSGTKRDGDPRWSPDGKQLAFTSKRDGETGQLYVMPADGGEPRKLTDTKQDVELPVWSPDGTRIAFVSRVPAPEYDEKDEKRRAPRRFKRLQYKLDNEGWTADRPKHLFVVPVDGSGPAGQLTSGDYEDDQPAWSPDGKTIAFASARHEDWDITLVRDLYLIDADGGEPELLTKSDGASSRPAFSPDGSRIAFLFYPGVWDDPKHTRIAVLDLQSRDRRVLTESLDRTAAPNYTGIREPIWENDETIVFAVEDSGNDPLYRVRADGSGDPELLVGGDHMLAGYDAAAGQIVYAKHTPTSLAELHVGDRQLTEVGKAFTSGRELVEPERFTAISADGSEVEAWVMRPAGFEEGTKYPMLLNIHGGPFGQYGNKFFDEFQVYAAAGYVVVYPNPRGSSGYSEEWARAIRGPSNGEGPGWGTVDYEDCMAVVDEAVKRFDFIDPDRLGVMGGSYGGYMTTWIIGHTDRFQAAISERAVNQFVSQWGSSDFGFDFKGYTGAFLFEDFEGYVKMSPATYATQITTPLLILHSEGDLRCPIEQGEHLFVTLRLLKRDVEMVRFPAEGHELTRSGNPAHRVQRFRIILEWLAGRLGGELPEAADTVHA
ncbi:MAG TPA: S9 family peptidase [Actinomycetota bacterium]|jgi:dipeptidyl aminopeptidase/acylaminoacyl peptidase